MKKHWKWAVLLCCILCIGCVGLFCYKNRERIVRVQDTQTALSLGYRWETMNKDAFVITRQGGVVYLLAVTEEAMERAEEYLDHNLKGDGKKVLLDEGESYIDKGTHIKTEIAIGQVPISDYTIIYDSGKAKDACEELQYYIRQTSNDVLEIASGSEPDGHVISLAVDESLESGKKKIAIEEGQVQIAARDQETLQEAVYLFVNQYLGWMKAGDEGERISAVASAISIPDTVVEQEAWMEEREAIICLWNINYNRGFYLNTDTTLENNIMDFSEEQLYEYVKMLKYCGYTGIQLTEMCSAWAGTGGYEAAHEKMRMMADAAHSLDMNVTIWVWGSEFTGYGWVDPTVTYAANGYDYAYQNPDVVATFEKYYSIYAELADCCDRLIGHFYDPGNLNTAEDIAFFSKMLRDKFQVINPGIDFGISCWVDVYDKSIFVRELGYGITLYESGYHEAEEEYPKFREFVKNSGCRLGTWAWNTCEMEIDQLAQMNFNMDIIRSVYQTARKYDEIYKPSYWSEMDSYHVLNVFSLYCAGQMLMNPDMDSAQLLHQISEAAVGSEYAETFGELLLLLQDARSGSKWDTYFWSREDYILKSDNYDAKDILNRCNQYIPVLDEMIGAGIETNTLPLPISLNQVLRMMRPHFEQIRKFAQFRMDLEELETAYAAGMSGEELADRIYEIGNPIESYNVIEGTWGQIEARAQREMVIAFCKNAGIEVPIYGEFDQHRKNFIYAQFAMYQRGKQEPNKLQAPFYQYGLAYGMEETNRLVEEMIADGLLIKAEDGAVYLADWENYRYHFN